MAAQEAIKLSILSPERRLVEGISVEEVTLPGSEGQIQILAGHAPIVGTLETGIFSYRHGNGQTVSGVVSAGFFEVKDDSVTLMAEQLVLKEEIDIDQARRMQKEAEDALKGAALDEHAFKKYQAELESSLVQQQLAGREHPHGH